MFIQILLSRKDAEPDDYMAKGCVGPFKADGSDDEAITSWKKDFVENVENEGLDCYMENTENDRRYGQEFSSEESPSNVCYKLWDELVLMRGRKEPNWD